MPNEHKLLCIDYFEANTSRFASFPEILERRAKFVVEEWPPGMG